MYLRTPPSEMPNSAGSPYGDLGCAAHSRFYYLLVAFLASPPGALLACTALAESRIERAAEEDAQPHAYQQGYLRFHSRVLHRRLCGTLRAILT